MGGGQENVEQPDLGSGDLSPRNLPGGGLNLPQSPTGWRAFPGRKPSQPSHCSVGGHGPAQAVPGPIAWLIPRLAPALQCPPHYPRAQFITVTPDSQQPPGGDICCRQDPLLGRSLPPLTGPDRNKTLCPAGWSQATL